MRTTAAERGLVLIADEDSTSRDQLAEVLGAAGYEILQVASGEEALEAARKAEPSIVLLEIHSEGYRATRFAGRFEK